jgi:stage II sporulation protein D
MRRESFLYWTTVVFATFFAFFLHSCTAGPAIREGMHVGEVSAPPAVQVGLGRCLRDERARIAVRGPYEARGRRQVLARGEELRWTEVHAVGAGVALGDVVFDESPITIVPLRDGTLEVEYARDARGNPVPPAAVAYHGSLLIHALADRRLALVNEVGLEDYLKGVVGKEMNLGEGIEALKTQVIAARTYAVHEQGIERLRRVKGEKFDLYDDERSQVYGGTERETALASRLVDETRGMFLMYESRLVRAFYASSCGGATEPAWEVMGDEGEKMPPLAGRKCDYCERRPAVRWKEPVVFTKKEIGERCLPKDLQGQKVAGAAITKTLPGGHALEVTLTLENSSRMVKLHANQDFRRNLSTARLKSTFWEKLEDRGDSVAVFGRGYGHGVGMCQVGAYEMARDGKKAGEILEYYFPGAKVEKVY